MSILTAFLASHLRTPHLIPRNIRWRMPRTVSDLQLVFVVGAPRSGTTLMQRVLASHSELFSIEGETGIFSARSLFGRNHFMLSSEDSKRLLSESCDIVDFFS
ncbi:MAG: sulfotransferase, partial [Phycisphaerales bacterium]|nr:sulfotransferase [Phycisphaerales bacterium]